MDDVAALAKHLRRLAAGEFSLATATALTRVANAVNTGQRMNLKKDFKLRNKFTVGSLMMFKATPKSDANKINALVGSRSPYLPEQETGGPAMEPTPYGWRPAKTMPSLKMRRGSWANKARRGKVGGDAFILRPSMRPRVGKRALRSRLKEAGVFVRVGGKLVKVRSILVKGNVTLKPTHWHTQATARFGKQSVIDAAWKHEIEKGLTKLGAR